MENEKFPSMEESIQMYDEIKEQCLLVVVGLTTGDAHLIEKPL